MVSKMIVDILTHSRVISYVDCLTQLSFVSMFGCMDDMLLTVMAYDQFLAICHFVYYTVIMNPHLSVLMLFLFFISLLGSQLHKVTVLQFTCFKVVEIANFFLPSYSIFNLSCSDILIKAFATYFVVLKISSSSGRFKAFCTCGSHLSVVGLFYGPGLPSYLGSLVSYSPMEVMVASLMYSVVTPMLNPFIYSLRNRDISNTLNKLHSQSLNSDCMVKI
ncbi:olfactory receptor 7E24-like [Fukomys damarensis]|uniref:olfactory receptor 7E24-like n=1 Tax=Fukomys damarensis TaxID=885580 RepID=UPI0014554DC4|nr:olfactory receptor 7E24-like [Fukomys damarensis]